MQVEQKESSNSTNNKASNINRKLSEPSQIRMYCQSQNN